jgi:hypothetical protein
MSEGDFVASSPTPRTFMKDGVEILVLEVKREQFVLELPNGILAVGAQQPERITAETLPAFTAALLQKRMSK